MYLTGFDYFSTLGYQPGIAFLAAGMLAPLATLSLVLVPLFEAYPVYRMVAKPRQGGQGSITWRDEPFPGWGGEAGGFRRPGSPWAPTRDHAGGGQGAPPTQATHPAARVYRRWHPPRPKCPTCSSG